MNWKGSAMQQLWPNHRTIQASKFALGDCATTQLQAQ